MMNDNHMDTKLSRLTYMRRIMNLQQRPRRIEDTKSLASTFVQVISVLSETNYKNATQRTAFYKNVRIAG